MTRYYRSLAEDDIDRYNQTWAFSLLLLLALTTWLMPLKFVSPGVDQSDTAGIAVECWFPQQLTLPMVAYAKSACVSAFRNAVTGRATGDTASVFYLPSVDESYSLSQRDKFEPVIGDQSARNRTETSKDDTGLQETQFLYSHTPVVLFVLAMSLKLPYIFWALFSGCGLGINYILESAKAAQMLDVGFRRQFKLELMKMSGSTVKKAHTTSSIVYLLLKVIMCGVSLGGLIFVSYNLLTRADLKQNTLQMAAAHKYSGIGLFCELPVRVMSTVSVYTIECIFNSSSSIESELLMMWLYQAIFTIMLALYVALVATNIISLLIWANRLLCRSNRTSVYTKADVPMDVCLLLYMARQNIGPLVASDLEQSLLESHVGMLNGEEFKSLQMET